MLDGNADVALRHAGGPAQHRRCRLRRAGLHARRALTVRADRIAECPVNLEARVVHTRSLVTEQGDDPEDATHVFEARITRVHVHDDIRLAGARDRIDPDRWRPLVMSFQRFSSLGPEVHPSRLATIDEEWYR
ncbi:MAG: hypothetical protein PGN24_04615 [Microbacterium arborescens]